jgi:hypothetical protein
MMTSELRNNYGYYNITMRTASQHEDKVCDDNDDNDSDLHV